MKGGVGWGGEQETIVGYGIMDREAETLNSRGGK